MSAFIVNPEHVAALAVLCARVVNPGKYNVVYESSIIAGLLMEENIKSLKALYPSDRSGHRPGPVLTDSKLVEASSQIAEYYAKGDPPLPDFASKGIINMIRCYEYQSCEHRGWGASMARAWMERLRQHVEENPPVLSGRVVAWEFSDANVGWAKR